MIEHLYRALLWLYPAAFRRRFGPEILETARAVDARGGTPRERVRAVIDAFGTIAAARAEDRVAGRGGDSGLRRTAFLQDITLALRGFRREPLFVAFVVGTLALATGANAALFGIADRLLIRGPAHVVDPQRIARLYVTTQPSGMGSFTSSIVGHVTYDLVRQYATAVEGVASYTMNDVTTGRGAEAREARAGYASAEFFPLLGVRPAAGRFFSADENATTGAAQVVVISDGIWRRQFAGAQNAIGRTVVINDEPHTIIGVAPRGFTGAELAPVDFWLPINLYSAKVTANWTTAWNAQWLSVIMRLNAGASRERTAAELTDILRKAYGGDDEAMKSARVSLASLSATSTGVEPAEHRVVRWMLAVAAAVLLIACANVMNLLLARGARRMREIGVRLALGASRARLVSMLLVESTLLAMFGAAVGLIFAKFIGAIARATLLDAIEWTDGPIDLRVLAVATVTAVVVGITVGVVPALGLTRTAVTRALKSGIREGGGHRLRLRAALTMLQATLSVALLIGAGLFVRSIWNAKNLDLGIDADRVAVVEVSRPPLSRLPDAAARDAERLRRRVFLGTVIDRIGAIPGVDHASVAVGLPFGNRFSQRVRIPGMETLPKVSTGGPGLSAVSADYFDTIGTRILTGRAFTRADRAGSAPVVIVNAFMARTVWPGGGAVGQCVRIGDDPAPCATIVGIAANTHRARLIEDPRMHIYIPLGQEVGFGGAVLLVRSGDKPLAQIDAVRRELVAADPTITFVSAETIQKRIDPQMRSWQLGTTTLAFSGLLALLVAAVGIYSLLSYLVADRRHELGVRIALGAPVGHVTGLVMRWSLGMSALGVAAGWAIAAAGAPFIQPLLFNVSARDPLVFASVAGGLLVVAIAASFIPALRAARVDPLEALRTE